MLGTRGAWAGCSQSWRSFPGSETPCGLQGEASFWVWEVLELSLTRPTQNQAIHCPISSPLPPWVPLKQPLVCGMSNSTTGCRKERKARASKPAPDPL